MTRFCMFFLWMFCWVVNPAFAGGAPAPTGGEFDWKASPIEGLATQFVMTVGQDQFEQAYNSAGPTLKTAFLTSSPKTMRNARNSIKCTGHLGCAIPALPANGGYKVRGTVTWTIPVRYLCTFTLKLAHDDAATKAELGMTTKGQ